MTSSSVRAVLVLLVFGVTFYLGRCYHFSFPLPDSDQFYHFSLSQPYALPLILSGSLPMVEGLHWGERFVDKEFFYHLCTSLAFVIHGESAVRIFQLLLASCFVFFVYVMALSGSQPTSAIASKNVQPLLRPIDYLGAALCTISLFVLDPFFVHRLYLIRPHTLAMFQFSILVLALLKGNRFWAFGAALLFALSYHALYIPVIALILWAMLWRFYKTDRSIAVSPRGLGCGFAGLVLGSLAHPHFPDQFIMVWEHLWFALTPNAHAIGIGAEVQRLTLSETWLRSPVLYTLLPLLILAQLRRTRCLAATEVFVLGLVLLFSFATLLSPRGVEYVLPLMPLFFVQTLRQFSLKTSAVIVVALCAAVVGVSGKQTLWLATNKTPQFNQGRLAAVYAAQSILNHDPSQAKKVFNCSFNEGPYLLYQLKSIGRFVDILDPRFLVVANPELHQKRQEILATRDPSIVEKIKTAFDPRYIICMKPEVNEVLDRSPQLKRIYPLDMKSTAAVQSYFILD